MRWPAALLVVLLAVTSACGGGDEGTAGEDPTSTSTTAASTTSTEGGGVHFDPEVEDPEPVEPVDEDPCTRERPEGNEAATIGDRIDCELPHLVDRVGGTTLLGQDGHLEVIVTGELDVAQALQVCEVAVGVVATELSSWSDVRLTITSDPTVVFGQAPTPLVTATTVGTCAPA